jgi:hypothetical protein
LRAEWEAPSRLSAQDVQLALPDGVLANGTAEGVAADGALLLVTKMGSGVLQRRSESGGRGVSGTLLAIDAGNTRIKWGMHDGARWLKQGWVDTARAAELKAALRELPQPQTTLVSNVAGERLNQQLASFLPPTPAARWIKSERAQCGVRNSYDDPAQLGCDRWAALIGARRLYDGPAVVVNAGTALTVDALAGDGGLWGGSSCRGRS